MSNLFISGVTLDINYETRVKNHGDPECSGLTNDQLEKALEDSNLKNLPRLFNLGLDTPIQESCDGISLGQKQIIAFMRAILRKPEILILDEATANINTVTEQQFEAILNNLPD